MKTFLYLVRHGATSFTAQDRFTGASDPGLSELGRRDAEALSARLANESLTAIYSSDMQRAVESASLIAAPHKLNVITDPALREVDHGQWEGRIHKEVEAEDAANYQRWDANPFLEAPPGGESGLQVLARSMPAIHRIVEANPGGRILVVSHKATLRLLIASLIGLDMRAYRDRLAQEPGCLNLFAFEGASRAQLLVMNDISHIRMSPLGKEK